MPDIIKNTRIVEDAWNILKLGNDDNPANCSSNPAPNHTHSQPPTPSTPSTANPTRAPESTTMCSRRATGYSGSTGTYPAPALATAHTATNNSTDRGIANATKSSAPTPRPINHRANRDDRSSNSRYVNRTPPDTTATADGSRSTAADNN